MDPVAVGNHPGSPRDLGDVNDGGNTGPVRLVAVVGLLGVLACSCTGTPSAPVVAKSPTVSVDSHVSTLATVQGGVGWPPAIAADPTSNRVYVAWMSFPNNTDSWVQVAVSADGGRTFGTPIRFGAKTEQMPLLAVTRDGTLFLAWTHWAPHRLLDPKSSYSNPAWLLLTRSDDGGKTWTKPVTVPTDRYSNETYFTSLAVSSDGSRVQLAWIDYASIPAFGTGTDSRRQAGSMLASVSADGGRTFGAPQEIAHSSCVCCTPTGFFDGQRGGVAFRGWEQGGKSGDLRNPTVVMMQSGLTSWGAPVTVHNDDFRLKVCPHMGIGSAVDPSGRLYVEWWTGAQGRAGYWFATSKDGRAFSAPTQLAPLDVDPHGNDLTVAIDGVGGVWMPGVLYTTKAGGGKGTSQVHYWLVGSDGVPHDVPGTTADGQFPRVAASSNHVYLLWVDQNRLLLRRATVSRS